MIWLILAAILYVYLVAVAAIAWEDSFETPYRSALAATFWPLVLLGCFFIIGLSRLARRYKWERISKLID